MTTTFFDGNFNPLTIKSSVSLTFQRYHFSTFSRMEDKILFTHQLFAGDPDEICTVPYTVDQSSITLDWEGQPCKPLWDGIYGSRLYDVDFHGYQYFIEFSTIYDSNLNYVHDLYSRQSYFNKENAIITRLYDDYDGIYRARVYYVVENVAIWFPIVMSLVGLVALALIIVGACYVRGKYHEQKGKRRKDVH